ncbi:MAG: FHA domain-containing protein [Planctomycetes bacterium]|nr:FHA domain-containing protein [Planctomycetota bacterium]
MLLVSELIITGPDGAVHRHRLGEKGAVLGRLPECEVVLSDLQSSRRHCRVVPTAEGTWLAEDLGSSNGSMLNGQPLKTPTPFRNGDTVQIGTTKIVLKIEIPAVKAAMGGMRTFDLKGSIVKLEEEGAGLTTMVDFSQKAGGSTVSDEEAATTDVAKLKRVTERLKVLIDVGQAMGMTLDPHVILSTALDKLFEVFTQADRGIVVLYGPDGSLPTTLSPEHGKAGVLDRRQGAITKVKQRHAASGDDRDIKLSRTVVKRVRTERHSVLVSAGSGDAAGLSMAKFELKSLMCAPLVIGDQDFGIIQIETKSREHAFTPEDLSLLTALAGQIAVVIRNSELAVEAASSAAQRENLSRFLSPQLVDEVVKGKLSVALGGTEKKGTIFFSDIVGFTKLASKMAAKDVVTLLNRYFTVMQGIVFQRGGSIDKCAGDNIMAHWGVIGDQPGFTVQGVTAAVEMQNALFAFNRDEARKKEIVLPPVPLGHGIGLNTGILCAGNIGSARKIEFTVIGDTVNLSSRIEGLAGRFETFVAESTWGEIRNRGFAFRMPDCPAKNVEKPVPIYSVRGIVPLPNQPDESPPSEHSVCELLLAMPCHLRLLADGQPTGEKVPGMVTCFAPDGKGGARVILQVHTEVPVQSLVCLEWDLPEKPSLPALQGMVEKCWHFPPPGADEGAAPPHDPLGLPAMPAAPTSATATQPPPTDRETTVVRRAGEPGSLTLLASSLPPLFSELRPGLLLQSDLKSASEIIRA